MSDAITSKIVPVVLSGGAGTRLWPMSRENYPKQLLPLAGPKPMLEETLGRFANPEQFAAPIVVTNEALRFIVAEQIRAAGFAAQGLLLEPSARNTAPAVAAAAFFAAEKDPEAVLLVVPSDHVIAKPKEFAALAAAALPAALAGSLVTFSIVPTHPETGYGYIRRGKPLDGADGLFEVAAFVEKPDRAKAEQFLATGEYTWNSGMFLFSAKHYLSELETHAPEIYAAVKEAVAGRSVDQDFVRLAAEPFGKAPSISIDYAVMERTQRAVTVPCSVGWTDVGSWAELWAIADKDENGNALVGDVVAVDSHDCLIRSERTLTATIGVKDLIVVVTDDAVLVTTRDRAQDVKLAVDRLKADKRSEQHTHNRVYRPWGFYQSLHMGERFQVKRLTVKPGAQLSLQQHYHRAEHWVVVNGTALVTRDDETLLLRENESIYLPIGAKHRLENPGKVPLNLIEVQSGGYLGEDDIVRFTDVYGRV